MRVVAVDPGYAHGAVAVVWDGGADVFDIPLRAPESGGGTSEVDYDGLKALIASLRPDACVAELVGAMRHDSPMSAFRFGYAAGVIRCAMRECCGDVRTVAPGAWKRAAMIFRHAKHAALDEARECFPELSGKLKRKRDVDRADALLIAKTHRDERMKNEDF